MKSLSPIAIPKQALTALIALVLATISSHLHAGMPSRDLWRSYIAAAQQADGIEDFKTEAIVLNSALSFAKQHDGKGQRRVLSQITLMLAYVELGQEDLWHAIAKENFRIDVGDLDENMREYVSLIHDYGWSYYNRWKKHQNDQSEDSFKQQSRLYGAENLFRVEIALRQKLMGEDEAGLGEAEASLGLVLTRKSESAESEDAYDRALQHLRGSNMKLAAMQTLSDLLSIGDPNLAKTERSVGETQIDVLLLTARNLVEPAQAGLSNKEDKENKQNQEDDRFALQVGRAHALYQEISDLTQDIRQRWPRHVFFGYLEAQIGWLYQTEFEVTKVHSNRYPDSFANAKDCFDQAIAILEYSKGANSPEVRNVASLYVDLLQAAGRADEAKKLAERYGGN